MNRSPSSNWYESAFQLDYLRVYKHRNDKEARKQIDFLTDALGLEPPLDVFDLGCGDGRHSVEWARRGYRVTGLDLSAELLEKARERTKALDLDIEFLRGDMRDIPYTDSFDLLVNFFTSFGYFREDEENALVLNAISTALRPGGGFLMDYLNRDNVLKTIVPQDRKEIDGAVLEQTRWISGEADKPGSHVRINKQVIMIEGDKSRTYEESVRMYTLEEMSDMTSAAGLTITHTFGDFDGRPVDPDAPRLILIGRKGPVR